MVGDSINGTNSKDSVPSSKFAAIYLVLPCLAQKSSYSEKRNMLPLVDIALTELAPQSFL